MDPRRFDRLTRLLGDAVPRRAVLAALLGAGGVAGAAGVADAGKKRRRARNGRTKAQARPGFRDCPNPKPGQNLSRCDFSGVDLRGKNLRGANLSGALFDDADLCGADLRGANLANVNFANANLTRVDFRATNLSTANLDNASLCQTRRPNGSIDNSGCPLGTTVCCFDAECPAQESCVHGGCAQDTGCPSGQVLRPNGSCAVPCNDDGDCAAGCSCTGERFEHPNVCMNTTLVTGECTDSSDCPLGSGCAVDFCYPLCVPQN
jgi:hypothetical protein